PGPVEVKPGMRHGKDWILELCFFPGLAAIDGYVYFADLTPTRPCQAGNLVIARLVELESGRRTCDDRFRRPHEIEPARLVTQLQARRGVVHALIPRHIGLIRNQEAPQPLDAVVGSKAGDEQPRRKTL